MGTFHNINAEGFVHVSTLTELAQLVHGPSLTLQSMCYLRHFQGLLHVEDLEAKKPLRYSTVPNRSTPPSQRRTGLALFSTALVLLYIII